MSEYEELSIQIAAVGDSLARYSQTVGRATGTHDLEIRKLWEDNAELRDEINAVSNRLENLTRAVVTSPAEVAAKIVTDANNSTLREVRDGDCSICGGTGRAHGLHAACSMCEGTGKRIA